MTSENLASKLSNYIKDSKAVFESHVPDLLHALEIWTESAVTAEYLLVHYGGDGQAVEAIRERLPELDVEAPFTYGGGSTK